MVGYLDEVHYVANTEDQDDRVWLDGLISTSEQYKKISPDVTENFLELWQYAMDRDTMYVKIDDDLVSMHLLVIREEGLFDDFLRSTSTTMPSLA